MGLERYVDLALCVRLAVTLLHFLWQGVAIAVGAAFLARFLARSSGARYNIYMASLLVMATCAVLTFGLVGNHATQSDPVSRSAVVNSAPTSDRDQSSQLYLSGIEYAPAQERPITSDLPPIEASGVSEDRVKTGVTSDGWHRFSPYIVAVYGLGVLAMCARLALALAGGKRLRRMSCTVETSIVLAALAKQSHALAMRYVPAIATCRRVVVPTVVGLFKPMILLPVSFGTGLTAEHIEMLLAHELAHIQRLDPLFNVIQRVIEAFLFFHPAMWFISRRVRIEREHCCDDIVLAGGVARSAYASCLVDVAERGLRLFPAQGSLQVTGSDEGGSQLRKRVLRVLGASTDEPLRLGRTWPMLALSVLLLPGMLRLTAPSESALAEDAARQQDASIIVVKPGESVQEAVDRAAPGTVIELAAGVHEGSVRIDKALVLRGAGWGKTTVEIRDVRAEEAESLIAEAMQRAQSATSDEQRQAIRAEYEAKIRRLPGLSAISVVESEDVVLRDMKLTMHGTATQGGVGSLPVVQVDASRVMIADCAIVGSPGDGVHVVNAADVGMEHCLVAAAWGTGVAVSGASRAHIRECDVRNCRHRCITIGRGCDEVVVERCRISGSAWHGVRYDHASPTIADNLLFNNARFGVYASGRTDATVRGNVFFNNEMAGMSCWFENADRIDGNVFAVNYRSGLEVLGASAPAIHGNIFYDNPVGVAVGNISGRGANRISKGTVDLRDNVFCLNDQDMQCARPSDEGGGPVLEAIEPAGSDGNVRRDPGLVCPQEGDFRVMHTTPGPDSPWPLQPEERAMIPAGETRDWRQWTPPVQEKPLSSKDRPATERTRGVLQGRVVDAATGEPIAGAYVGTGDFGDSGGSNYSRHRERGYHASTKTDGQGRFMLEGLAFVEDDQYLDSHTLVVTHPDYVRCDRSISLTRSAPEPRLEVPLRKAARLEVTVVDAEDQPKDGIWAFRLERLDGRRFLPPGRDPHLSAFASAVWLEQPRPVGRMHRHAFTFTQLDIGDYRVDVFALQPRQERPSNAFDVWAPRVVYHGGLERVTLQTGQAKSVTVRPASFGTGLTIDVPGMPEGVPVPQDQQLPQMALVCLDVGVLAWDMDRLYGLEDARLGRLQQRAFFMVMSQASSVTFENLPPGRYAVFAGPVVALNGAEAQLVAGRETALSVPVLKDPQIGRVGTYRFDRPIEMAPGEYDVQVLCEQITRLVDSRPTVLCEASIQGQQVQLAGGSRSIWGLLECLCGAKGWRLSETDEKTLLLGPPPTP